MDINISFAIFPCIFKSLFWILDRIYTQTLVVLAEAFINENNITPIKKPKKANTACQAANKQKLLKLSDSMPSARACS